MASSGASYYVAPIALTEDLVKGATVSGTINGVQVSGTVGAGRVVLYAIAQVPPYNSPVDSPVAEIGVDAGNYQIALEKQPESDLTIHLTQATPAHAVTIPEEYLELTETNAAIETAQNAANTAQSAASSAQNAANTAQNAANAAKTTAEAAKATAEAAKATAENAVRGSIQRLPNATSLNYYLTPSDTTADSIDSVRTFIGFPGNSSLNIIVKDETYPSVTFTPPSLLEPSSGLCICSGYQRTSSPTNHRDWWHCNVLYHFRLNQKIPHNSRRHRHNKSD